MRTICVRIELSGNIFHSTSLAEVDANDLINNHERKLYGNDDQDTHHREQKLQSGRNISQKEMFGISCMD